MVYSSATDTELFTSVVNAELLSTDFASGCGTDSISDKYSQVTTRKGPLKTRLPRKTDEESSSMVRCTANSRLSEVNILKSESGNSSLVKLCIIWLSLLVSVLTTDRK